LLLGKRLEEKRLKKTLKTVPRLQELNPCTILELQFVEVLKLFLGKSTLKLAPESKRPSTQQIMRRPNISTNGKQHAYIYKRITKSKLRRHCSI
jgi:hypothetical protein